MAELVKNKPSKRGVIGIVAAAAALALAGCGRGPSPGPSPPCNLLPPAPQAPKGAPFGRQCEEFFADSLGQRVNQNALTPPANLPVTIVDPLPSEVCRALGSLGVGVPVEKCTYVHMKGFGSQCAPAAPPDSQHTYIKVTYSADCTQLMNGANNATGPDTAGDFDWSTGVYKACADKVVKKSVSCYEPVVPGTFPFFNNSGAGGYPEGYEVQPGSGACNGRAEPECAVGNNPFQDASCDSYFGGGMNSGSPRVTIVDQDVPELFCRLGSLSAPCVYIHKVANHATASGDTCINPTPPDACHKYQIVKYTSDCDTDLSKHGDLVGTLQEIGSLFDSAGVLKSCAANVDGPIETKCFAPVVASDPELPYDFANYRVQECTCPETLASKDGVEGMVV